MSKLLGTLFELNISSLVIDDFLEFQIDKKFNYWNTATVNFMGWIIIVKKILFSSMFLFAAIWGGSKGEISKTHL